MPQPDFPAVPSGAGLDGVKDYLIMLRRRLNDFLAHLDTLNVDELNADVVNAGTLNAALVTIKSALTSGATITMDGTGIKIEYPSGSTITFDELGFTITRKNDDGTDTDVLYIDTFGNASYTGNIDVGANINVDSNVTIGDKLYINPINYGAGIRWATTGGNIDIYIDPASKALFLSSPYGVLLNGVNVVSEINSLKSRCSSLEARVTALGG